MEKKMLGLGIVGVGAVGLWAVVSTIHGGPFSDTAHAQERPLGAPPAEAREVRLSGRVVDLHTFMTGPDAGPDAARMTAECIRNGVPVALETKSGLIVLGQGAKNPARTLLPLAHREVVLGGRLYEKAGVKYLDMTNIARAGREGEEESGEAQTKPAEDKAEQKESQDEEAEQEEAPE